MAVPYTQRFFNSQRDVSLRSARKVVPILVRLYKPNSVLDVGCGTGTWLSVFKECGVHSVLGLDGSYVDRSDLLIAPREFEAQDLAQPLTIDRRFDLTLCVEVAEHLPESAASMLIEELTRSSQRVVFSAAIPGQGGTHHVNEQWQSYWARLFLINGYYPDVAIRGLVWDDLDVEDYYAQNLMVFSPTVVGDDRMIDVVHPRRLSLMRQTALAGQLDAMLAARGSKVLLRTQVAVMKNAPRALMSSARARLKFRRLLKVLRARR